MWSLTPSIVVLGLAACFALALAVHRTSPPQRAEARRGASRVLAIAVGVQCLHFLEESGTGFPRELGAALGLPAMPFSLFVAFNVGWLMIWAAAVFGLRSGRAWAFFAGWFLAIAGAVNGIAHPLLAFATGGYFPGLITSPLIAAVGGWLMVRLARATQQRA